MKITYKKILMSGLVVMAMMSSCSDEFLNQEPSTAIPSDQALNTDADVLAAVNGMYSSLQATDLYGRTKFVLGDLLADNSFVSVENAGRYITFEGYTHSRTSSEIAGLWTNAYVAIGRANEIINSSQGQVIDQAAVDNYKGEAYAVRALMYFELVRHFGRPYTDNPNGPGVPIVLERAITAKPGRNTVTEVYNQINSDLDKAYTMLTKYNGTGRFSKFAARALAAKVALYQGDDALALQYAEEVISQSGFSLIPRQNVISYWGSAATQTSTKNETLFEVTFTEIDNNGSNEIADMYSQQGGYGDILTTEDVYNLYSATDVRKDLIIVGERDGGESPAYIINKFSNVTGDRDDRKILRVSEMYLIAAEAAYNLTQEDDARDYLNRLVEQRDPSLVYSSTGAQLLADIVLERRKELAFEGERFHTLNRLQMDVTGRVDGPPSVAYSDFRRILPIPQVEIDANPTLATQQNPNW